MIDWSNLPEGTPVWVTVIVVLTMLAAFLSERLGKLKGPIGALARWWNGRAIREVQQKKRFEDEVEELVDKRVERRMEGVDATIQELRGQVEQLRNDLNSERESWRQERAALLRDHAEDRAALIRKHAEETAQLRHDDQMKWRYIVHVSTRLREYRLWEAEHGHQLPPPAIPNYYKWLSEQRARNPPDDDKND